MSMTVAFKTVLVMLLYALPGYIMIKTKLIEKGMISAFAKLLMYLCQPALIIYTLTSVSFSKELFLRMVISFVFMTLFHCFTLLLVYFLLRKKTKDVKYRIYTLATSVGNYGFMGIPVLKAMLPKYPEAMAFCAMVSLSLNIIGWSLGSYIISQDKKYIKPKKIFVNPAMIAFYIALPLFLLKVSIPKELNTMVTLLSDMTTPLCMLIMGMRLATTKITDVFGHIEPYIVIFVKQMVFPLLALLLLNLITDDYAMKASIYIMVCCPVASIVLNFAELIGKGQETASHLVLLGTTLSALTIPFMVQFM